MAVLICSSEDSEQSELRDDKSAQLYRVAKPLVLISCVTAVYALIAWRFTAAYMVNDDVAMESIASGKYTGAPDSGLVFVGPPMSVLLALLYELADDIPWYAIMLYGVQILSVSTVLGVVWVRRRTLGCSAISGSLLALVVFVPLLALLPTFTSTAFLAGIALVVAVVGLGLIGIDKGFSVLTLGMVAVLVLTSGSLRWESFVGSVMLALPLLAVASTQWTRATRWRLVFVAGVAILLVWVAGAFSGHGAGWSEFDSFNEVRGQLHGNSRLESVVQRSSDDSVVSMLRENGWELEDVYMFGAWFYDDPATYDQEKLERLLSVSDEVRQVSFSDGWSTITTGRGWLLVLVAICVVAGVAGRAIMAVVFNAVQLAWAALLMTYISMTQRFPDRVAHPALLGVALLVSLGPSMVLGKERSAELRQLGMVTIGIGVTALVSGALVVIGPIWNTFSPRAVSSFNEERIAALDSQIAALKEVDSDGRFVYVGDVLDMDGVSLWREEDRFISDQVIGLGWPTFSPPFERRKDRLGLGANVMLSVVDQDDVYLVVRPGIADLAERTYERRLGFGLVMRSRGSLPNGAEVYSVERAPA